MVHRYLRRRRSVLRDPAIAGLAIANRRDPQQPSGCRSRWSALVILQALLGMWTVTLLLKPLIVVAASARWSHDAGVAVVARARATARRAPTRRPTRVCDAGPSSGSSCSALQIVLGGWISRTTPRSPAPISRRARIRSGRTWTSKTRSCCGAASASTTKAACSITRRASRSISRIAWARSSRPSCSASWPRGACAAVRRARVRIAGVVLAWRSVCS